MTQFWERYSKGCEAVGEKPSSQKMATQLGVTKSAISAWNTRGIIPNGKVLSAIADMLHVSVDYIIGRTDDPTDYVHAEGCVAASGTAAAELPEIVSLYNALDPVDRAKVEGIIQGLLMADKYHAQKGRTA